jgi:hypothetical protein
MSDIKRTSGPQTTDGKRWAVTLSAIPPREWLQLFRGSSGEPSASALPQRVEFDRASASFKTDEDHVAEWIGLLDKWIAWTNARHDLAVEKVDRERADRAAAATKEKERIQELNDRFKDL